MPPTPAQGPGPALDAAQGSAAPAAGRAIPRPTPPPAPPRPAAPPDPAGLSLPDAGPAPGLEPLAPAPRRAAPERFTPPPSPRPGLEPPAAPAPPDRARAPATPGGEATPSTLPGVGELDQRARRLWSQLPPYAPWLGLGAFALLALSVAFARRRRAAGSGIDLDEPGARQPESLSQAEVHGALDRPDLIERRLDAEVRARTQLEERVSALDEELKVTRDRLHRVERRLGSGA